MAQFRAPVAQRIEQPPSKDGQSFRTFALTASTGISNSGALSGCSVSFARHQRSVRRSASTIEIYQRAIYTLANIIGDKEVSSVTRDDIREFLAVRGGQVSTTTGHCVSFSIG